MENILIMQGIKDALNANYDVYIKKFNNDKPTHIVLSNRNNDWCSFTYNKDSYDFSAFILCEYDEYGSSAIPAFITGEFEIDDIEMAFSLSKQKREEGIIEAFDPGACISEEDQNCFFTYYKKVNKNDFLDNSLLDKYSLQVNNILNEVNNYNENELTRFIKLEQSLSNILIDMKKDLLNYNIQQQSSNFVEIQGKIISDITLFSLDGYPIENKSEDAFSGKFTLSDQNNKEYICTIFINSNPENMMLKKGDIINCKGLLKEESNKDIFYINEFYQVQNKEITNNQSTEIEITR